MVDTFGTGKIADDELVKIVRENFDLRPAGIIKMLDLRRPIYRQTAAYGHFGRKNDIIRHRVCSVSYFFTGKEYE